MYFSWLKPLSQSLNQKKKNLYWLNFALFFRQIAIKLSGFYLPIFLYQMAPEVELMKKYLSDRSSLQQGMILVALFFVLERLTIIIFSIPVGKLTRKIGHARTFVLGDLIFALLVLAMIYFDQHQIFIFISTILSGLKSCFFWQSYRTLLDRNVNRRKLGRAMGLKVILSNFVAMLSPAIGGLIIKYSSYDYIFYLSLVFLLVAVYGHLNLKLRQELDAIGWKEYFSWLKENSFRQLFLSQSGRLFNSMALMLWPLYVFLLMGDIGTVGIIYSLSLFISIVMNFFIGGALDKNHKNKTPFVISGAIISIMTILKIWVSQIWNVVVMDSLDRMVGNYHWLVFDRMIMARGKGSQAFSYFVYRMINQSISGLIFWLFFLTFFLVFSFGWTGVFVLGSIGAMLSLLIDEKK
ncbi:MAG: MFS transporter [Patescibacteria group bacterium]|nr:MFS transporter [Patescibacteria group bacterium]